MTRARRPCIVPHCRRTTGSFRIEPPDDCWICSVHWRLVPARMKAIKRRARKALRRYPDDPAAAARYGRISRRVTRCAVESGLGL